MLDKFPRDIKLSGELFLCPYAYKSQPMYLFFLKNFQKPHIILNFVA